MATLRDMVDGHTLDFAASPAAQHVAKHIADPFGSVKPQVDKLNKARMNYELEKQNMRMQLAPVQKVTKGISDMHQLEGPGDGSPLDMSPNNPENLMNNQPPQPMLDENGMVMGQPNLGSMTAPQGAMNTPNDPGAQIDDESGTPENMAQTPGAKMNMNRPSMAGFQPGVSPGPAQSVRPGKMGTPQPGQGKPATVAGNPNPKNMPAGWTKPGSGGTGNQPGQYNKGAAPPKGNRALPGAKGPGDPKVANRTKKAQGNSNGGSGRPIHVEVRADSMMTRPAVSKVAQAASSDVLRQPMRAAKVCSKCGKVHAKGMTACNTGNMKSSGTSEGSRKGWDSRGRGKNFDNDQHWQRPETKRALRIANTNKDNLDGKVFTRSRGWTAQEKALKQISDNSHPQVMEKRLEARDFSQGRRKKLAKTGVAMPGGGFPIVNKSDLANAKQAIGRAKNPAAARRHINERARALGAKPIGMAARMANLTQ